MVDGLWTNDRFWGYGGVVAAVAVLAIGITASANRGLADWLLFFGDYLVGLIAAGWLLIVTIRHAQAHRHGPGGPLLITAWVLTAVFYGFAFLQALDPANPASLVDKIPGPADLALTAGTLIPIPLAIASIGLLRDAAGPPHTAGGVVDSPT